MGGEKPLFCSAALNPCRKLLGHAILAFQYKWDVTTNKRSIRKKNIHIGAETAASLGALRKSKPTPIQDSSFPRQEFHTEPRRLPSAFSNQAPVLAEAGSVLSSTSVEAAAFSSFNDTPEPNSVQAVSHDESATYPGVQGLLTTPFPW